jgi:small conductance mechanosensitive channel
MNWLNLSDSVNKVIERIPEALLTLFIGIIILYLLMAILKRAFRLSRFRKPIFEVLVSIANVVGWTLLVIFVLRSLGLTGFVWIFSSSVAIIGIIIGAGSRDLIADIASGFALAQDKDFALGKKIKIGDVEGQIESIDFRKTRVRDKDGSLYIIPNSKIEREIWQVFEEK